MVTLPTSEKPSRAARSEHHSPLTTHHSPIWRWFIAVIIILIISLILESGLLAFAAYVLLAMLFLSRFMAWNWIGNLTATRQVGQLTTHDSPPTNYEIGQTVPVKVIIKNDSWLPVPWVLMEDLLPQAHGLTPEGMGGPRLKIIKGRRLQLCMLRPGRPVALEYTLKLRLRGYYQIGPMVLESGDVFGLHRRYRAVTEPHFLVVYPKVVPLEGFDLASRRPVGEIRLAHRLFEDPTRIAGVREYQRGDPLNRVHWRATARTGTLHSKIYEPSTIAGATIVLDFHKSGYAPRGEPFRSELAATTAASLANAVYETGQQVGLVTNGRDAADRIRLEGWDQDYRTRITALQAPAMLDESTRLQPQVVATRRGVEQFQLIRETLGRVELTDGLTFAQLVLETADRLPRDATVIAILPEVSVLTALALGNLRRQGYAVSAVLILIDDEHFEQNFGRLMAEGISDIRHLRDEKGLPTLCQHQAMRGTPYLISVDLV
jgi:uncharacterized protein (DUF58 family)